jgi:hypothetical protein
MTIPPVRSSSDTTSPAMLRGPPRSRTASQPMPRAMEMIGSAALMIAWTGASKVPCW